MSIKTEINRIKAARNKIRNQLVEFGIATNSDNITRMSSELAKVAIISDVSEILSEGESYAIPEGYYKGKNTVTAAVSHLTLNITVAEWRQFRYGNGIKGVKTLVLPNIEQIESMAFDSATELETVDIGGSVQNIHSNAFDNCTSLTGLIFRGLYKTSSILMLDNTPIGNKAEGAYIYVPDEYLEEYKSGGSVAIYHADRIKPISELEGGSLQSKTVTPSETQKKVTPDEGYYGLSDVTVEPIPNEYKEVTMVSATPETVLENTSFVNMDGFQIGTMPNNGNITKILSTNGETFTIPKGYHDGAGVVVCETEGVEAPYSGAVYPWLELNLTDVAAQQFKEGAGLNGARTVIMPNVNSIRTAAFISAPVEVIDIGAGVQSIHFAAFNNCAKLTKLIFRGLWLAETQALQLTGTAIKKVAGYIYVPDEYLEQYKSAANWSSFASQIKPISEL